MSSLLNLDPEGLGFSITLPKRGTDMLNQPCRNRKSSCVFILPYECGEDCGRVGIYLVKIPG